MSLLQITDPTIAGSLNGYLESLNVQSFFINGINQDQRITHIEHTVSTLQHSTTSLLTNSGGASQPSQVLSAHTIKDVQTITGSAVSNTDTTIQTVNGNNLIFSTGAGDEIDINTGFLAINATTAIDAVPNTTRLVVDNVDGVMIKSKKSSPPSFPYIDYTTDIDSGALPYPALRFNSQKAGGTQNKSLQLFMTDGNPEWVSSWEGYVMSDVTHSCDNFNVNGNSICLKSTIPTITLANIEEKHAQISFDGDNLDVSGDIHSLNFKADTVNTVAVNSAITTIPDETVVMVSAGGKLSIDQTGLSSGNDATFSLLNVEGGEALMTKRSVAGGDNLVISNNNCSVDMGSDMSVVNDNGNVEMRASNGDVNVTVLADGATGHSLFKSTKASIGSQSYISQDVNKPNIVLRSDNGITGTEMAMSAENPTIVLYAQNFSNPSLYSGLRLDAPTKSVQLQANDRTLMLDGASGQLKVDNAGLVMKSIGYTATNASPTLNLYGVTYNGSNLTTTLPFVVDINNMGTQFLITNVNSTNLIVQSQGGQLIWSKISPASATSRTLAQGASCIFTAIRTGASSYGWSMI